LAGVCPEDCATVVSPGITAAAAQSSNEDHGHVVLGGELSLFELWSPPRDGQGGAAAAYAAASGDGLNPHARWAGAYVDGVYDFGTDATRFTVGPEAGMNVVGIDGGLVVARRGGKTSAGFAIRPVFALGFVQFFARYERVGGDNVLEIGGLLKWPQRLPDPQRHN